MKPFLDLYTHFLLEPAHGLLFADAVPETDAACFPLLVGDAEAGSAQNLSRKEERGRAQTKRFITTDTIRSWAENHIKCNLQSIILLLSTQNRCRAPQTSHLPRRSPDRRCRCWGRTWCPDRCAPGCRSRSFRCRRSCSFSTRTHAPGGRRRKLLHVLFFTKSRFYKHLLQLNLNHDR